MTGRAGEPSAGAIPAGNVNALDGEVRRLEDLKERLWSTGEALRDLIIDGWQGPARDSFDDFRYGFARQWLTAGDLHEDAARALERYRRTLVELRRLAATADPTMTPADIARWRQQATSEARTAAAAIRRAAAELAGLPHLLAEPPTPQRPETPPAPQPSPLEAPPSAAGECGGLDPRTAHADPAGFARQARALCDELLTAQWISVTPA